MLAALGCINPLELDLQGKSKQIIAIPVLGILLHLLWGFFCLLLHICHCVSEGQ